MKSLNNVCPDAVHNKAYLVVEIEKLMESQRINKVRLSEKTGIGRSTLDRVLDPENLSINLVTLIKIADALGKTLSIKLMDGK